MSSGSSRWTGPGRSSVATRKASRTMEGIASAETICRVILVIGRIAADDVDDLEARLPRALDRLLAGDHHHRHGAEIGIGRAGGEIQRAGAERREADAGRAGEPSLGRRHEGRGLLVARQHQLDRASAAATRPRRGSPRPEVRRCAARLRFPARRPEGPIPWCASVSPPCDRAGYASGEFRSFTPFARSSRRRPAASRR